MKSDEEAYETWRAQHDRSAPRRRLLGGLKIAGLIGLLILLLAINYRVNPPAPTPEPIPVGESRSGIKVYECGQDLVDSLDALNKKGQRARITTASCVGDRRRGYFLDEVQLVAVDGRKMKWHRDEGTDELAHRLHFGR